MVNPFLSTGCELVALGTQDVMEWAVAQSLIQIHEVRIIIHAANQKLEKVTIPISDTTPRNNVFTFANRPNKSQKGSKAGNVQKQNTQLVNQLFLSLQSRPPQKQT